MVIGFQSLRLTSLRAIGVENYLHTKKPETIHNWSERMLADKWRSCGKHWRWIPTSSYVQLNGYFSNKRTDASISWRANCLRTATGCLKLQHLYKETHYLRISELWWFRQYNDYVSGWPTGKLGWIIGRGTWFLCSPQSIHRVPPGVLKYVLGTLLWA